MEEARSKLGFKRVLVVWIEMGILFVIGVFGLLTTMEVVEFDSHFRPYFVIGLVGIAFVLVLYLLAQRGVKWVWLLGIPFIAAFAFVTWLGYVPAHNRSMALERYLELIGPEIEVEYGGEKYDWHGYLTTVDEDISSHTSESQARARVDEEEETWTLYYDSSENILYSTGATGTSKYLMQLQKKE